MKCGLAKFLVSFVVYLLVAAPTQAFAAILLHFTPTDPGGIYLDLQFHGIAEPDPAQSRWIEVILPGGTIARGGISRSDLYVDDTLVSESTVDGQQLVPSYVRLGNDIWAEQIFSFVEPGILTGQSVDMHIVATWNATNLP